MVGMGSVVTRDLPAHALAIGNPARIVGVVCRCGQVVARCATGQSPPSGPHSCPCGRQVPWPA